jgi:hypothetical protein
MCDNTEHVHGPECEPEVPTAASQDPLLARLNAGKQLTEAQFRLLRGRYFTVRHYTVPECGHKLDMINEPSFRNCEYCWWAFFSSHGELVQVTDEAFQTHGSAFVDRMRGVKYRKMFTRYMSTLAAFQKQAAELKAAQEKNVESGNVQEGGSVGEVDGQRQGRPEDLPAAGGQGVQASPVNPDEPVVVR